MNSFNGIHTVGAMREKSSGQPRSNLEYYSHSFDSLTSPIFGDFKTNERRHYFSLRHTRQHKSLKNKEGFIITLSIKEEMHFLITN